MPSYVMVGFEPHPALSQQRVLLRCWGQWAPSRVTAQAEQPLRLSAPVGSLKSGAEGVSVPVQDHPIV